MQIRMRTVALAIAAGTALASCSTTGGVTGLTADAVTLGGTVDSGATAVTATFQYATARTDLGTAAGIATPPQGVPAQTTRDVTARVTGLTALGGPDTTIFYRLCTRSTGADAPTCSATREFSTPQPGQQRAVFDLPGTSTFTVPAGVRAVAIDAAGGAGGTAGSAAGGKGGRERAIFTVRAGDRLVVRTGSAGLPDTTAVRGSVTRGGLGGTNGTDRGGDGGYGDSSSGAGGGAPSRVDLIPAGSSTATTLLVGAGGGGAGGDTARSELLSPNGPRSTPGGDGGGLGGSDGSGLFGGGGAGATAPGSAPSTSAGPAAVGARPGAGHDGGRGATVDTTGVTPPTPSPISGKGGGGGGGGWFGGGGADGSIVGYETGGGVPFPVLGGYAPSSGGGGSSGVLATIPAGSSGHLELGPATTAGVRAGNGVVTLSWIPAAAA